MPDARHLSFIVPAHNEERLLDRTLESIRAAAAGIGRPYEVIVVDDASTDRTAAIARDFGARVVPVELRQIAAVRNAGARQSTGQVLVFIDADTILPEPTLRAALTALDRGAVGGGATLAWDGPTGIWAHGALRIFTFWSKLLRWTAGCFVFVRREAFEAAGGFDQRYYAAEELLLSRALKRQGQFVILPEQVVTSARKGTARDLLRMSGLLLRLLARGPRVLQRREGLGLWYAVRSKE